MCQPSRASSTMVARLARVCRNWLAIEGRSPGGATAFPPSATTMVRGDEGGVNLTGPGGWSKQPSLQRRVQPPEPLDVSNSERRIGLRENTANFLPRLGRRRFAIRRGEQVAQREARIRSFADALAPGDPGAAHRGRRV